MTPPQAAVSATLAALAVGLPAGAQIAIVREPVYAFDAKAILGAGRAMTRTRFSRSASSSIPHELAVVAAHRHAARVRAFERFFASRLDRFLADARRAGLPVNDVGEARAAFLQVAFRVYDGRGFGEAPESSGGVDLWGGGAIAAQRRSSAWLARFAFVSRIKYAMGKDARFVALTNSGKQRIYDYYALACQLLLDASAAAQQGHDTAERALAKRTARDQLRLDLGVDPDRVHFTPEGLERE